jgi:membrane protein DedA with SNARE-associated domain
VVPPAEVPSSAASSGLPLWTVVAIAVAAAVLGAGITYLNMRLGRAHHRRAAHAPTV